MTNLTTALAQTLIDTTVSYQTYLIEENVVINHGRYAFHDCTFLFAGGCIISTQNVNEENPTLAFQRCEIVGSGRIFENISIEVGSTLNNTSIQAEWFGALPSGTDVSSNINEALEACYMTSVHNLQFNSGIYYVNGEVKIGKSQEQNEKLTYYFDIKILGTGNFWGRGTTFKFGPHGKFIIDSTAPSVGVFRSGGIYECCFGHSQLADKGGTALEFLYAATFTVYKCTFSLLETAIKVFPTCYYMDIVSCTFDNCDNGIQTYNNEMTGTPNNNMVHGCWFVSCSSNPINLANGVSWHIYDCDFEGNNGTIVLGKHTRLDNVRIERNLSNVHWIEISEECEIDAEIHAVPANGNYWRCICNGKRNKVRLRFAGYNPCGLISYSNENQWNITNDNRDHSISTVFVVDPDDQFCLNGWRKENNYFGTNLVTGSNLTIDENDTALSYWDGTCYPLSGTNKNITINNNVSSNSLYKTARFCPAFEDDNNSDDTTYDIGLFERFLMRPVTKWYHYVSARNDKTVFSISNRIQCYTAHEDVTLYLMNIVVSRNIPLYDRPVLAIPEENTQNQWREDKIIHLENTCVNHLLTNFSWKPDYLQFYTNKLGKTFFYSSAQEKYFEGNIEVFSHSYVSNGSVTEINNTGSLPFVMRGLLNVKLEMYDKQGNHLFLEARRGTTTTSFQVNVISQSGLTYFTNNQWGTIQIYEHPGIVYVWMTELV